MIALGATAARALLGRAVVATIQRGRWFTRDDCLRVLVMLHPSALLRIDAGEHEENFERWLADLRRADAVNPR